MVGFTNISDEMKAITVVSLLFIILFCNTALGSKFNSSVYVGGKTARVSDDGFQDYFGDIYNNQGSKSLWGLYWGGNYSFYNGFYITGDYEWVTRSSTSLEVADLTTGYAFTITPNIAIFVGAGGNYIQAERKSSCQKDQIIASCDREVRKRHDYSAVGEIGAEWRVGHQWLFIPSYRYRDSFERGLNQFSIDSTFSFSRQFAMEVGYAYVYSRNLTQSDVKIGFKYNF